jgi:hypothetical protein
MTKKIFLILMAVLAIIIGCYPAIYFFVDSKFGLLSSKSEQLLANMLWNIGFYTHITCGGIALLIGWVQFNPKLRYRPIHRNIGKVYVVMVLLSAVAGLGIAFSATGGIIAKLGFICLALIWFGTTLMGYLKIRQRQFDQHQKMMVYSYAACFAAVTLRIWLPLLVMSFGDFIIAYRLVAWLCWVPNIIVAFLILKRTAVTTYKLPLAT